MSTSITPRFTFTPELNRLTRAFGDFPFRGFDRTFDFDRAFDRAGFNAYSYDEDENNITISADLPGIKLDDLKVSSVEGRLSVQAERNGRSYHYAWDIPSSVDVENISAAYEDGVLTLTLPKSQSSKLRSITVKTTKELASPPVDAS